LKRKIRIHQNLLTFTIFKTPVHTLKTWRHSYFAIASGLRGAREPVSPSTSWRRARCQRWNNAKNGHASPQRTCYREYVFQILGKNKRLAFATPALSSISWLALQFFIRVWQTWPDPILFPQCWRFRQLCGGKNFNIRNAQSNLFDIQTLETVRISLILASIWRKRHSQ